MTGRLNGKVTLISGSGRGMGAAEARRFAAEGAKVVVSDILEAEGEAIVKEIGDDAVFARLDVTQEADWQQAVQTALDTFGRLDVLVNNAGILRAGPLTMMDVAEFRLVTEVNQVGVFLGMKTVAGAMAAAGGGSIINISSIDGIQGSPFLCAYAAAKFAVRGMTKVAALELAGQNIRVNSIHPGGVSTPMCGEIPGLGREQVEGLVAQSVPLRRIGQPEEIASMAVFLASDESAYCTGAEFVVDGGATCGTIAEVLEHAQ